MVSGQAADVGKRLVLYLLTMLLSSTVHEYAHARVADALGDDTPRRQGRVTLSPLAHYDVWGTFLIPTVAILAGGFPFIGWAKPVETQPSLYTRRVSMRNGHRMVAVAGPLSNLLLAVISAAILSALHLEWGHAGTTHALAQLLQAMILMNLGLFVLNLLPIPPLDGSRLLPKSLDELQAAVAPYSFLIMMMIVSVPVLRNMFFWPVSMLAGFLWSWFGLPMGLS